MSTLGLSLPRFPGGGASDVPNSFCNGNDVTKARGSSIFCISQRGRRTVVSTPIRSDLM